MSNSCDSWTNWSHPVPDRLLCCYLGLLLSSSAAADPQSKSYSSWNFGEAGVQGVYTIASREVTRYQRPVSILTWERCYKHICMKPLRWAALDGAGHNPVNCSEPVTAICASPCDGYASPVLEVCSCRSRRCLTQRPATFISHESGFGNNPGWSDFSAGISASTRST